MDSLELISLFKNGVINEIYTNVQDKSLQDTLISYINEVEKNVIDTYKANK